MDWKIYYSDGSTFSSEDVGIADVTGIQVIILRNDLVGRVLLNKADYYVLRNGDWYSYDIAGLRIYLKEAGLVRFGKNGIHEFGGHEGDIFSLFEWLEEEQLVYFGEMLKTKEEFRAIYDRALEDPDFPRKSAYIQGEQR